jgi:hypothetical protein
MKTRESFVSNSSTCSFIFIGFDVTGLALNEDRIFSMGAYRYMNHTDNGAPEGKKLLGYDIAVWDDNDMPDTTEIDLANLDKVYDLDSIRHEFGIMADVKPKIYTGTRMC